jgi:hypothetical protein
MQPKEILMSLVLGVDASTPPAGPYPGSKIMALYFGGNTPHVATRDEWDRFAGLRQLGIWTGYLEDDPGVHARQAAAAAHALGFSAHAVHLRYIALDFETEIDPAWVTRFAEVLRPLGYGTLPYGSLSTITADPACEGIWAADWDGTRTLPDEASVVAKQFAANVAWGGSQVDLSVFEDWILKHLGYGPRG